MAEASLQTWQTELEQACLMCGGLFSRVVVVPEAGSTQDVARERCEGKAGLVVAALRQTAGRGRLGRSWADTSHLGVAISFVVDACKFEPGVLSLAAGLAAAWTIGDVVDEGGEGLIGIKWPNDVVEKNSAKKSAGVLIEQAGGLAVVGIGINVRQQLEDLAPEIADLATSLAMMGADVDRLTVASKLILRLNVALSLAKDQIVSEWVKLDVLRGTTRTFEHSGSQFSGIVEEIDPLGDIVLTLENGDKKALPALATTLVKEQAKR